MPLTVDTSIWVNAFTPTNKLHASAKYFVVQVLRSEHSIVLPYSVLTETVCKISNILIGNGKNPDIAVEFGDTLFSDANIKWVEIDRSFAYDAAMFGRLHRLRGMDALIAYTALKFNCELFTADNDFFKSANRAIKVRHLGEFK